MPSNFNKATAKGPANTITDVWLTPRYVLDALGPFDLDPCSCPTWQTAKRHICLPDDGLAAEWRGRVWLNPPYSDCAPWLQKLAEHGDGIALVYARTDTKWFQATAPKATAINFLAGRIRFLNADTMQPGNSPAPSILIAFGEENAKSIGGLNGMILRPSLVN